jgi:hypothetical protein
LLLWNKSNLQFVRMLDGVVQPHRDIAYEAKGGALSLGHLVWAFAHLLELPRSCALQRACAGAPQYFGSATMILAAADGSAREGIMGLVQLAAMSAALAAATVTMLDYSSAPSPARFLADQADARPAVSSATPREAADCADRAWPYRDGCGSASSTERAIRVIGLDSVASSTTSPTAQTTLARR